MTSTSRRGSRAVPAKTDPALRGAPRGQAEIDVRRLTSRLRAAVTGEVRFDAGPIALYASDASNYRQVPIGVVVPKTLDDVVATRPCRRHPAAFCGR